MSFTQNQVRKLRAKLKPQHIRTREADGIMLSYLEGWNVIAEANRIFGFEGWDRETISSECVWTKQVNGRYCASYVARIRIRVRAGDAIVVREGSGAGESNAASPGQAHEFAAKAAETDATKRALMTFGNAFGLSLYGGTTEARGKLPHDASSHSLPKLAKNAHTAGPTDDTEVKEPVSSAPEVAPPVPGSTTNAAGPEMPTHSLPVTIPGPQWPHIRPLDEAELWNITSAYLALPEQLVVISEAIDRPIVPDAN